MKKGTVAWVLALALLSAAAAWGLGRLGGEAGAVGGAPRDARIVSLAPALTETLFAIGAGDRVVGVSDWCLYPPAATSLPRVGSGLSPGYEAITRLQPTLIVNEKNAAARLQELSEIAPTRLLPWLALDEVVASIRELGRLTDRATQADALADRFHHELAVEAPPEAPRVLLVLEVRPGKLSDVVFVRRNSLHGAVLRAAGGRNAVGEDVLGMPRLSLERVVELDPDMVIVLLRDPLPGGDPTPVLAEWRTLETLTAVQRGRVGVLSGPEGFANGPRILDLVDRLAREIRRLES